MIAEARLTRTLPVIVVLVAVVFAPTAVARSNWSATIGVLGTLVPGYEGSDHYEAGHAPLVDVTWRHRLFIDNRKGVGAYIWKARRFRLSASVDYTSGRDDDDGGGRLDGLGNIDGGARANLIAAYKVWGFVLASRFIEQFTGDDTGYLVDLSVKCPFRYRRVRIIPSLVTEYASGEYMDVYFGVSPAQAARSTLPSFEAHAGLKSVSSQVRVILPLSRHWALEGIAGYKRLLADAADSPVTAEANQFGLGLGIGYRF